MRTVLSRVMIAAACAVCFELLGAFSEVAIAQTPGTQPGGDSPGTGPTTPPPGTQPGGTPPGTDPTTPPPGGTPPGTDPTPPPTTPPGTEPPPGNGNEPPGETPPPPSSVDPLLVFLMSAFEATREFVVAEFPDAPPEFQDWLTGAVFTYFFGDLVFEYLFGPPPDSGLSLRRR
jgi:hypothetical protein